MAAGFCKVPAAPVYLDASHKIEMTNQLLFGEPVELLETARQWTRVRSLVDGYEGWMLSHQLMPTDAPVEKPARCTSELISSMELNGGNALVPLGSFLSANTSGMDYRYSGPFLDLNTVRPSSEGYRALAMRFLNAPYLWGGKTILGIDCSGFTQLISRMNGVSIRRDAYLQAEEGRVLDFLQEAKAGDLAFFENEEGRVAHTGILLGGNEIIHASVKVRIDAIDNHGIINRETGERTHRLRIVKRFF